MVTTSPLAITAARPSTPAPSELRRLSLATPAGKESSVDTPVIGYLNKVPRP